MNFQIKFSKKASKFLRRLPEDILKRIKLKFKIVGQEPFRFLEHYEGDYHKLRIGPYRALVDVDFRNKIIYIEVFDKRSRVYKG